MNFKRDTKFSFSTWLKDNCLYFLAFILPVLSMLIVYFFKGVAPFGDQMYLRSDCYHQYTPYLQILQDKLHSGGSLFYTWEIGAGMNFVAIAAYYLSSPLNLLTILWPGNMADYVSFFIIVKMGLAGFSATYYLVKRFHKKQVPAVIFGMIYALSAYFAAFSWNIMWLDCMWLLPFIILGLDRLVTQKRYKMYCIALALSIFSNYYIGIMLCIYSVIYFIYLLCVSDFDSEIGQIKARLIAFKDFAIYSVLGGGLAACVILPEYFNLLTTKSADSSFPETIEEYFSILYMLFRSLICIPVADLKYPHDPNIYCTVAVFVLIPLFWICKKISIKERVGKTAIAVIMLLSFNLNIPNYIWHGLHFPNSLPCRESFLYIFLIITMAYEAFIHLKEYKPSQIIGSMGGSLGLILVLQELFKDTSFFSDLAVDTNIRKIIYFSMLFIIIYVLLFFCYRKKSDMKAFFTYLLVLTMFCELTLNMCVTGMASTSSRAAYYESTQAHKQLNEVAKQKAENEGTKFYRTESASHSTRNDGARFNYNSISTFSSVASAAMQEYYNQIGMQTSFNAYSYYGHTPLTAALFSIKYEFTSDKPSLPKNMTEIGTQSYQTETNVPSTIHLYEYNNTLPLGFMMNMSTDANWDKETGNPFMTQNNFVKSAVNGGSNIFHKLQTSDTVGTFTAAYQLDEGDTFKPTKKEQTFDIYFYCVTSSESLTATITNGSITDDNSTTKTFSSTNQNYICHIGNVSAGSTITITSGDGQALSSCYAYAFDEAAWKAGYELLNANPYIVDSYSDTKITGKVTTDKQGIMYTSIPYDEGWTVYIDGEKSKTTAICSGALTGVLLEAGTHDITFKYTPKGFMPGILISLVCLLIFLGIIFRTNIMEFINKKSKKPAKK
ncbi:YfhO family protein [uncultured Eubacterium sp.]|uniref:YfhO family protein n=1 Tax=uncultured Eubacterium sp. TaxID=165185 RepID=UPI002672C84B|nr:YfhO family protein [uncultured Eubacterium sp.]